MFITFEGIDGCGKTTQLNLLKDSLERRGFQVLATKQPGGSEIGRQIRHILLDPKHTQITPETEVLLYLADRLQHLHEIIVPALNRGDIVLCDRYHDATLAYQGGGRRLDLNWQLDIQNKFIIKPDLTLWLDISIAESRKRLEKRNIVQNVDNCRLEREDDDFFIRVRARYQRISQEEPLRFIEIPAEESVELVQKRIVQVVAERLD